MACDKGSYWDKLEKDSQKSKQSQGKKNQDGKKTVEKKEEEQVYWEALHSKAFCKTEFFLFL